MKIVVSAKGRVPDGEVGPRFGRAPCLLVFDTGNGAWQERKRGSRLAPFLQNRPVALDYVQIIGLNRHQ